MGRERYNAKQLLLPSPLHVGLLFLAARLGWSLPHVGLVLSALGWGTTAVSLLSVGRAYAHTRSDFMIIPASLLVISPLYVPLLGTAVPLSLALAWCAVASTVQRRWRLQTGLLCLLVVSYWDWSTLFFVLLLLMARRIPDHRLPLLAAFIWTGTAFLLQRTAAVGIAAVLGFVLTGLGLDWVVEQLDRRNRLQLTRSSSLLGLALLLGAPIGVAQLTALWQGYQNRPVSQHRLSEQTAAWLQTNSPEAATILGSPHIGFLAERSIVAPVSGTTDSETAALKAQLVTAQPEYAISYRSIPWDNVTQWGWFQLMYEPLVQFSHAAEASAPLGFGSVALLPLGENLSRSRRVCPDK